MVDKVLIGSRAVEAHLGSNALGRQARDWDYLTLVPLLRGDSIDGSGILDVYPFESDVATLDEVYTLKVSHSPWIITTVDKWSKHMGDIRLLRQAGCRVIEPLHEAAYRQWEIRKGPKKVNLDQEREKFFGGGVTRYFHHDSVHAAVALSKAPAFNLILGQESEVKVSRELFGKLDHEAQKRLVYEEAMVLSLERDLLPRKFKMERTPTTLDIYESYRRQLRLLITVYSKGWWPRWIIENYFDVLDPPLNYWDMFWDSDRKMALDASV